MQINPLLLINHHHHFRPIRLVSHPRRQLQHHRRRAVAVAGAHCNMSRSATSVIPTICPTSYPSSTDPCPNTNLNPSRHFNTHTHTHTAGYWDSKVQRPFFFPSPSPHSLLSFVISPSRNVRVCVSYILSRCILTHSIYPSIDPSQRMFHAMCACA